MAAAKEQTPRIAQLPWHQAVHSDPNKSVKGSRGQVAGAAMSSKPTKGRTSGTTADAQVTGTGPKARVGDELFTHTHPSGADVYCAKRSIMQCLVL